MSSLPEGHDQFTKVEQLAEQFLHEYRHGQDPSVESYCDQHPQIATEIREVFEALLLVEDLKPRSIDQAAQSETPRPVAKAPEQIAGYRILREVGRGGMGVVFEAEQESLNRRVALKVLSRQGQGSSDSMARFESEARAAARMHHTNIVPVFEVGTDEDYMFYAMQLIHGQGLDKVIEEVRSLRQNSPSSVSSDANRGKKVTHTDQAENIVTLLVNGHFESEALGASSSSHNTLGGAIEQPEAASHPQHSYQSSGTEQLRDTLLLEAGSTISAVLPGQSGRQSSISRRSGYHHSVAEIGRQVARALAYAHGRGVLHRDIKPSNLMLDATGTVWVTDFGLAKIGDESLTHTGDILGTLRYMSPERFQGDCDARADIYSLGLTLHELLVLQPAFYSKDRLQLIELVTKSTPPAPRSIDPQIPRDLETIILKCIDPIPRHRYQTADELADELGRFLAGEPVRARAIGSVERIARWCRRNPWVAALSAVAMVSLLTGTIASTIFAIKASQSATLADQRATGIEIREKQTQELLAQVEIEKQHAERELNQSQRLLNLNRIQSAHREWTSHHAATAWRHLNAYNGNQFDWEHRYLFNLFRRNHTMLTSHRDEVNAFDISADGKRVVSAVGGRWNAAPVGEVRIHDRTTGATVLVLNDYSLQVMDVAFHPDGSQFVSCCMDGSVHIRDSITGERLKTLSGNKTAMFAARYNHDGSRIVGVGHDGEVLVWNAVSGDVVLRLVGHRKNVADVEYSPDSSLIVTASRDNTLKLWDASTGDLLRTFSGHHGAVNCVAFDATGSRIVSGCWDSEVIVWEVGTGRELSSMQSRTLAVYGVAFSPDGSQVVSGSYDQKIRIWETATGKQLRSLEGHTGTVYDVAFNADGSQIISAGADRTVRIWDSGNHDETYTLNKEANLALALVFSPDSRQLLSVTDRPRIRNIETGEVILTFEGDESIATVAWSHDGLRVAGAGRDGKVVVWDPATGQKLLSVDVSSVPLLSIALSRDGSRIAVGGEDSLVYIIDAETGKKVVHFDVASGAAKGVAFSPDGQRVYAGGLHGAVRAWDASTGKQELTFTTSKDVYAMALSGDGTLLASAGSTPQITIWDTQTGEEVAELTGHNIQVFALDISPDGSRLIAAGSDQTIEIWDLIGKESTLALEGHRDAVISVAFSATGEYVATSSRDGTTKIWNASEHVDVNAGSSFTHNPVAGADSTWVAAEDGPCPPSSHSAQHSLAIIENHQSTAVRLYWSDADGVRVDWGRIESGSRKRLSTYAGHSWVLTDEKGSDLGHLIVRDAVGTLILSSTGAVVERVSARQHAQKSSSVLENFDSVLRKEPANAAMFGARASWFGAHGRWDEATADMKKSVQLDAIELTQSCYLASLLVFQKQKTAYAEHCQRMLQTWKPSEDPRSCERAAKACLLLPDVVNHDAVDQLVEKALTVGEDYAYFQYFLMLKGLNALRNNDFKGAIEACEQSRSRDPEQSFSTVICTNSAIEALAHHHLGHPERAKKSLATAKRLFETVLATPGHTENLGWPDWLIAKILYDEAGMVITSKATEGSLQP